MEIEGKGGWIIGGGGGPKGMLTPSQIIGGAWARLAPSSYAYDVASVELVL